ncbi:MAG: aminotransferase class V-fold PLP-dependent enzyme, partial [Pseudomonadales bacterium]|nr:aminotransferase class V-fold PLP-dependent enzyme [Pseudomonadales bacterium]
MANTLVYLDYAATTPVDELVFKEMAECMMMSGDFGNPASRSHIFGWKAEQRVEAARKKVADSVNCDVREIVWTSGATEADNLAIKGVVEGGNAKPGHVICSAIEHKAVLDSCAFLERLGCKVTRLKPGKCGVVEPHQVVEALRDDTCLVSIMHVNNETGGIHDIESIGALLQKHPAFFHVDAAQSVGKLPIDL